MGSFACRLILWNKYDTVGAVRKHFMFNRFVKSAYPGRGGFPFQVLERNNVFRNWLLKM